ncbi:MAG TPA: hypothetical protein VNU68_03670 [Verrucomicrobiae bacterium]|nr:hypothetical protein [Verrucomicrobiae bacterium]
MKRTNLVIAVALFVAGVAVAPRSQADSSPSNGPPVIAVGLGRTLATVNTTVITVKDLIPISAGAAAANQVMPPATYQFLLDRAIARELIFQAAKAKGIQFLNPDQARQRDAIRKATEARDAAEAGVAVRLDVLANLDERIQFEQRDATSQFLLSTLLGPTGITSPNVTEAQVVEYYNAHSGDFPALPGPDSQPGERESAWRQISNDIRRILAPIVQAQFQQAVRTFIEQLKAQAQINVLVRSL